jgi:hypothetical protein
MIAILLPSYRRYDDIRKVLSDTKVNDNAKFIVVANYPDDEYNYLLNSYSDKALFVDEKKYGKLGGCKAYNLAYEIAKDNGFDYAILFADDVIPFDDDWLEQLENIVATHEIAYGIFSSDECHHGHFGWNIIKDCPIGHFFIIRIGVVENLFDPSYKQYVIDLDISVRIKKMNLPIGLLPIKLRHFRSELHREAMGANYEHDKSLFYQLHPEYSGWLDGEKAKKYVPDAGEFLIVENNKNEILSKLVEWPCNYNKIKIMKSIKSIINVIKGGRN